MPGRLTPRRLLLQAAGFDFDLNFPEQGLLLVTGDNGAGKSVLCIDAIEWALFGESERSLLPDGLASLTLSDGKVIERRRKKARVTVDWLPKEGFEFETTTKAQAALERMLGFSREAWHRQTVFSSEEVGVFSRATDKRRKELVEELIPGFDRYERGLKECRADLSAVQRSCSGAVHDVMFAEGEHKAALACAASYDEQLAALGDVILWHEKQGELEAVRVRMRGLAAEDQRVSKEIETLPHVRVSVEEERDFATRGAEIRQLQKQRDALKAGNCPTCGQPAEVVLADLEPRIKAAIAVLSKDEQEADASLRERRAAKEQKYQALCNYRSEVRALYAEREKEAEALGKAIALAEERHDQRRRLCNGAAQARARAEHFEAELEGKRAMARLTQQNLRELEAVEQVLGLRGVRAVLLGRTVEALSMLCNVQLSRFWPGVSVVLELDQEKQTLVLRLVGHPKGHEDTRFLSKGELRRLDMALFLARRELLQGGNLPVVVDEALDGLDQEGVESMGESLAELARDHLVVVISHQSRVWDGLPFSQRWAVAAGRVAVS